MFGLGGSGQQTVAQTTTGTTSGINSRVFPQWTQNLNQWAAGTGIGLGQNFLQQAPTQALAGFTPDQLKGFDLTRGMAKTAFTQPQAELTPTDYQAWMNPFLADVGKSTVDTMRREYGNNVAQADAAAANSVAFGGSGSALQKAQMARNFNEDATNTVLGLLSGGFDKAQGLASNAEQINDSLRTSQQNRQAAALEGLLGTGRLQQQQAQAALDVPWTILERVRAGLPSSAINSTDYSNQTSTQTQTQPDQSPSGLQQLLGIGSTILGMGTGGGGTVAGTLLGKLLGKGA